MSQYQEMKKNIMSVKEDLKKNTLILLREIGKAQKQPE